MRFRRNVCNNHRWIETIHQVLPDYSCSTSNLRKAAHDWHDLKRSRAWIIRTKPAATDEPDLALTDFGKTRTIISHKITRNKTNRCFHQRPHSKTNVTFKDFSLSSHFRPVCTQWFMFKYFCQDRHTCVPVYVSALPISHPYCTNQQLTHMRNCEENRPQH